MTEQEAIDALDGLRKAFRMLDQTKAMQAFNVLMNSDRVVTTAFNLGIEFGSALTSLKRVFEAIENKGIYFPQN